MTNPNHSVNPISIDNHPDGRGLTKREYFAAMALQGILANTRLIATCASKAEDNKIQWREQASIEAVEIADKLIKALNDANP